VFAVISIHDYGARANVNSNLQAQVNARAFMKALDAVNAANNTDRTLVVPADGIYLMTQVNATNLYNVTIVVGPGWHSFQIHISDSSYSDCVQKSTSCKAVHHT
jgi:2-keto-3-deoxy-L-rhamnonate aldolase RhmA